MTVPFNLTPEECPQGSGEQPGSFAVQSGLSPICIPPGSGPTVSSPEPAGCAGSFWAKITGIEGNKYSWIKVNPVVGGGWEEDENLSGDFCSNTAYELNGSALPPTVINKVVRMSFSVATTCGSGVGSGSCETIDGSCCEYVFNYCCAPIIASPGAAAFVVTMGIVVRGCVSVWKDGLGIDPHI